MTTTARDGVPPGASPHPPGSPPAALAQARRAAGRPDFGPFDALGSAEREALERHAHTVRWRARAPLPPDVAEGERLSVLREGRVALLGSASTGHRVMLALLEPGAVLSTLGDFTRLDAMALQDSTLTVVPRALLASVVRQRPVVALAVMDALSERTALLREVAASVGEMRTEDRLWARMCLFAQQMGTATPEGALLDLPMTHEQWGMLTGASREAITLAFGNLRRKGLVRSGPGETLLLPWGGFGARATSAPAPRGAADGDAFSV